MTVSNDTNHLILEVQGLVRVLGGKTVLDHLDLRVERGHHMAILGPSGCGKSTLLRAISGLDVPESGTIFINEQPVSGHRLMVPPHKRGVGLVFQNPALWPHMTVTGNIRFGLHGLTRAQAAERVHHLLKRFQLESLAKRHPDELSGGEARRTAIARAMAPRPALLLLDEPMTHLDNILKEDALQFLLEEAGAAGTTLLFVTHDESEAAKIADTALRFQDGRWVHHSFV